MFLAEHFSSFRKKKDLSVAKCIAALVKIIFCLALSFQKKEKHPFFAYFWKHTFLSVFEQRCFFSSIYVDDDFVSGYHGWRWLSWEPAMKCHCKWADNGLCFALGPWQQSPAHQCLVPCLPPSGGNEQPLCLPWLRKTSLLPHSSTKVHYINLEYCKRVWVRVHEEVI